MPFAKSNPTSVIGARRCPGWELIGPVGSQLTVLVRLYLRYKVVQCRLRSSPCGRSAPSQCCVSNPQVYLTCTRN